MGNRDLPVLLAAIIVLVSLISSSALAGDQYNPEVEDDTGETGDPTQVFRDIEAAWFGGETNDSMEISMKLVGEPPGLMDLGSAQDTTIFEYEVYFDVEGSNYAVVCTVQYATSIGAGTPLGGVYSPTTTWGYDLRQVSYAAFTDVIQSETSLVALSSDDFEYDSENVVFTWTVNKADIGVASGFDGRGQELVNTWAAVWNSDEYPSTAQRDPVKNSWDYAQTHHTDPGKNYRIKGKSDVDYNVELSADEVEKTTFGGTPAEFVIYVFNNGSQEFVVELKAKFSSETWNVSIEPAVTTIAQSQTRTVSVSVTPPKDVDNGTELIVVITGTIDQIEGNETVDIQDSVTLTTIGLASTDDDDKNFLEMILNNIMYLAAVILGIALIVIIVIIVAVRRK